VAIPGHAAPTESRLFHAAAQIGDQRLHA